MMSFAWVNFDRPFYMFYFGHFSKGLKKIKIENDHSQNITPQQPNLQHVQGSPMPMGYEQFKPPQNNLNGPNSGRG
jgi:hypothetical protein